MPRYFLLIVCAIGGFVRFYGISFGLSVTEIPGVSFAHARPDEEIFWARALDFFSGDLNPHFFIYPSFFKYLLGTIYALYFPIKWALHGGPLQSVLRTIAINPSDFILISRGVSAAFGTASILLVYRLGKEVFSELTGRVAALIFALTYLHVRDSHFGVADVLLTFMILLTCRYLLLLRRNPSRKHYLVVGVLMGIAASTKWMGAMTLVPFFFVHYGVHKKWTNEIFISLGAMAATFTLTTPYAVLAPKEFYYWVHWATDQIGNGLRARVGSPWLHHLTFTLWYGLGWPVLLSSIVGVFLSFRHKNAWPLLAFSAAYYVVHGFGDLAFVRYMVPLTPFAALFAAWAIVKLFERFPKIPKWGAVAAALLLLMPSMQSVFHFSRLIVKEDSRVVAAKWVSENASLGEDVYFLGSDVGSPAIPDLIEERDRRMRWPTPFFERYLSRSPHPAAPRRNFVLVSDCFWIDRIKQKNALSDPTRLGFARLETVPGAGEDRGQRYDPQDAFFVPFVGAEFASRPGPDVHIFLALREEGQS